ncbi:glycoside hydrolase superfamily [Amylostereum chailletii]|nr:glycoside hydrolase superfamily [Amylostereum chailletii]
MALAATQSPELAEKVYAASARELKMAGINWAYSPVADVNSDSRNPVIGVRSFGDDPHKVGEYVVAAARGLTSAGVAPSPKHFPGHGDTHVDSHLALPVIPKSLDDLRVTELVPFRAVATQSATIMTGHIALPAITGDDTPASLSRSATYGLLREELKYEGVIVTDCLEMAAVAAREGSVPKGSVDALRAGADIVMVCHTHDWHVGSVEAAWAAVQNGDLDLEELAVSGRRIAALKARFAGTWDQAIGFPFPKEEWDQLKEMNLSLSAAAYAASTALIQDPKYILPFKNGGSILILSPVPESINLAVDDADGVLRTKDGKLRNTAGPSYVALAHTLRSFAADVHHVVYAPDAPLDVEAEAWVRKADGVICATRNADRAAWQLDRLREVQRLRAEKEGVANMVGIASCAPYDMLSLKAGDLLLTFPWIATFEFTAKALEAAAGVIFGAHTAVGRVPVCDGKVVANDLVGH